MTRPRSNQNWIPKPVLRPLTLFGFSIFLSVIYGLSMGGRDVFFDWRNLFLGVIVGLISISLITNTKNSFVSALSLILVLSARSLYLLCIHFSERTPIGMFGVQVPVFDGPTLSNSVAGALLSLSILCYARISRTERILLSTASSSLTLLVVLSMRRTYWGELALGLIVLAFSASGRTRLRIGMAVLIMAAISMTSINVPAAFGRVRSILNPTDFRNRYAATNYDHIGDVLDAWGAIKAKPLLGWGQGLTYPTKTIQNWKRSSWGVHNGPLHVWLRYGLIGLVSWMLFHKRLFAWLLYKSRSSADDRTRAISFGVLSYWMGSFVMSLAFSPWPYGALQNSMLFGVLFGLSSVSPTIGALRRRP